jgi:hypothetical protein
MQTTLTKENMENQMTDGLAKNMLCPFLLKPFEGCYCTSTSSLYTEATIYYCGGNFEKCDIYKRYLAGQENS